MNTPTEYGYLAIYNGKRADIRGEDLTLYAAKLQALKELKVPKSKSHMLSIMLAEKDGAPITHTADF